MDNNFLNPNQPASIWVVNPHLKTLLLVLIFVFLGCGIFLIVLQQMQMGYRQKIYDYNVANWPKHQPGKSADQQISNQPADIKDWKTYKNEKYGFEFQYPPIDYREEKVVGSKEVVRLVDIKSEKEVNNCHCGEISRFTVSVYENPKNYSTEAYINTQLLETDLLRQVWGNLRDVEVGGVKGVAFGEMDSFVAVGNNGYLFVFRDGFPKLMATFTFTK